MQLALTATRVDQKNFGLWLRNWQVGQVLQALVTDKTPSGQIVLRIGGQQITATADIPVQKGATLQLEVTRLDPTPTLKILNPTTAAAPQPAATTTLGQQLQALLPNQGEISTVLTALFDPAKNANILAVLGTKAELLEALFKTISRSADLAVPTQLQQAMQKSGLFLEATLAAMVSGAPAAPFDDLKTALLRLRAQLEQTLAQLPGDHAALAQAETLRGLKAQVDGALTTIILHQLTSQGTDANGNRVWITHLPFTVDDAIQTLSMQIFQDRSGRGDRSDDEDADNWKVMLSVALPRLGMIETELYLHRNRLSLALFAEHEATANLLSAELDGLQSALASRGIELSAVQTRQGKPTPEDSASHFQSCVDTQA